MDITRKNKLLNRKKTDPSHYTYTGFAEAVTPDIQLFRYSHSEFQEYKSLPVNKIGKFTDENSVYWLNIDGLNDPALIAGICHQFGIHSLIIQDILDVNQRAKFQEFDHLSYLTIKSVAPFEKEINTEHISFILGENFLISFQEKKGDYFEHLRFRLREHKGIIRERSSDYLLYALLEAILDNYFKTLDQIDSEAEKFNLLDQNKEPSPNLLMTIEKHKKMVHFINKSILPLKEFSLIIERKENKYIKPEHIKYFVEIKDLCLTLIDSCEIIQSSLDSSTNLFFSIQGYRMNRIMKMLTIVATIFIPLTFITGIYGMNFKNMPELNWQYGYFALLGILFLILLIMISYLRRKKWL
ncbi:MAG TPA: magnesium/cobalt transporter CorA [Saprospiraceae bacterium]|nr:magnesium/cobalt transporter CorA [Saprospiraceae bacterium]